MRIFVAGGTGTLGVPLVRALVGRGHEVTALTRTPEKVELIHSLGAASAVADALDAASLGRVVAAARPTHVIHQLTALPKEGPMRASDLIPTNRLRIEGTRNLLAAAIAARAGRFIGGSFAFVHTLRPGLPREISDAANAMQSMETQILEASRSGAIEGLVLRYGMFYGPGNPATVRMASLVRRRRLPVIRNDRGLLPFIHLDDAVAATVAALESGQPGTAYDIVDDQPVSMREFVETMAARTGSPRPFAVPALLPRLVSAYLAGLLAVRLPLSNAHARAELSWRPMFPTIREGLDEMRQSPSAAA